MNYCISQWHFLQKLLYWVRNQKHFLYISLSLSMSLSIGLLSLFTCFVFLIIIRNRNVSKMYKWIINNDALIIITTMHKCKESFYMAWLIMVSKMFDLSSLQKSLKCTCDEIKTELFFQKIFRRNFRNSLRLRHFYLRILIFDNIVLAPIFLWKQKATQEVFIKSGEKDISYSKKTLIISYECIHT